MMVYNGDDDDDSISDYDGAKLCITLAKDDLAIRRFRLTIKTAQILYQPIRNPRNSQT